MTAKITEGKWKPLAGAMPKEIQADTIYVVPTMSSRSEDGVPLYTDNVRYLPKEARAAGIPLEFATSEGSRKFQQQFSVDPEVWDLAIVASLLNPWLIFVVETFLKTRAKKQGWTHNEAKERPLKLSCAETATSETFEVEGKGSEVLEALKIRQQRSRQQFDGGEAECE